MRERPRRTPWGSGKTFRRQTIREILARQKFEAQMYGERLGQEMAGVRKRSLLSPYMSARRVYETNIQLYREGAGEASATAFTKSVKSELKKHLTLRGRPKAEIQRYMSFLSVVDSNKGVATGLRGLRK